MEKIFGLHACLAAINNQKRKIKFFYCTVDVFRKIEPRINLKHNLKICKIIGRNEITKLSGANNHQGIFIEALQFHDNLFNIKQVVEKNIVILDNLSDHQNIGSIIRSAYLFGIKTILYYSNNNFTINSTLIKAASGAYEKIDFIKITNINFIIKELKKKNYWIVAIDKDGDKKLREIPSELKKIIIFGSEKKGVKKLIKQNSDIIARIPMIQRDKEIESLNISNAATIVLYEICHEKQTQIF